MLIRLNPTALRLPRTRGLANIAQRKASEHQAQNWAGTCTDGGETKHFIDGRWVEVGGEAREWYDVRDPVSRGDGSVVEMDWRGREGSDR